MSNLELASVPFKDLANKIYIERAAPPEQPRDIQYFFAGSKPFMASPFEPYIAFYCDPMWNDRNRTKFLLSGVNSAHTQRVSLYAMRGSGIVDNVHPFTVYDFPVDKLKNPAVTDRLKQIEAADVQVVTNTADALKLHSWVVDQTIKERVNDWFKLNFATAELKGRDFSEWESDLKKYVMLRQAPYTTSNVPGVGKYTYEGVVEEASKQTTSAWDSYLGKMVEKPVSFRMFGQEDVEWLREHYKQLGLPIPE